MPCVGGQGASRCATWGDKILDKINEGVRESSLVIAFLSESFLQKNWPKRELYAALDLEDRTGKKKVLPLMLGESDAILREYPLLADKIFVSWKEGVPAIVEKCKSLIDGSLAIVKNIDFPVEDREELARRGYTKKGNIVRSYKTKLDGNSLSVRTDLPEGTNVLVVVAEVDREELAMEIGARSAVLDTFAELAPDKL